MRFSAAVKGCDPVIRTKKADKNEILFEFRTVFVIEILFLLLHFTFWGGGLFLSFWCDKGLFPLSYIATSESFDHI